MTIHSDIYLLRGCMAALRGARNPHVLMCTFRFLRAVRLAMQPLATIYVAMYNFNYLFSGVLLVFSLGAISNASAAPTEQTAVFAGGCFWGVDAVFKHVKGVMNVESGYAGGKEKTAHYEMVGAGNTGHAESVRVRFDPAKISYQQLLQVFFSVAHDPTELNRQGPDTGTQYRSAIFYTSAEQQKIAQSTIQQLTAAHKFSAPIVTQVVPLQQFYPAEDYHQNYLALHPYQPYIVFNDKPKLEQLRKQFPALYQ